MCSKSILEEFIDKNSKKYYTLMIILSFLDLIAGLFSMFVLYIWSQILSLSFSIFTLLFLIFGYIIKVNDKKTNSTVIVSIFDVIIGIISLLFMINSIRILAGIASGATGFKIIKTIIQTEKVKKFLNFFKPKIMRILLGVTPKFILNFIDKIKKNQKGEIAMKKINNFFVSTGNVLKNNIFTTSGSLLVIASAGLSATWAVDHIISTKLLPIWAAYIVGIAICLLLYGFIEFTVLKYGAENTTQVRIRKGLKNILNSIGAVEMVAKIEEIEKAAIEEKEKKDEELAILAEAKKRIEEEKKEAEDIEQEAKRRIEEEKKVNEEAAAQKAKEEAEELKRKEREEKILAAMKKLKEQE